MEKINSRTPDEVKSAIEKCVDGNCNGCAYYDVMGCSTAKAYDALAYIQRLEAHQPKWISVEERLPEEAGKYIVCTRKMAVYCTAFRFFHGKGHFATDSTTHITHWMPLPSAPEGE